jgi:hypothetical protein
VLPSVLEALGELAAAAKEGLLALSVGVGLGVLHELMEARWMRSSARRASTTRAATRSVMAEFVLRTREKRDRSDEPPAW